MIKVTFEGNTLQEVHEEIKNTAEGLNLGSPKASTNTDKGQAASTATTSEDKTTSTDTKAFDEIEYSGESTKRNLWILLTDGRVIAIKAGGAVPVDEMREKNITKKEFEEIAEEEPERVVKNIAEVIDEEAKGSKKKDKKEEPKDEPVEDEGDEGEGDEDEDEGDGDSDDMDRAKELVAEAKEFPGGKKFVKELLEDYDVKRVTKIDDEDDLADFIEDLEEYIEEQED